ncbi:MAG: SusC/RagA family TonB-linked outer membrane protein, partial [Butyricimonas paravirosa]
MKYDDKAPSGSEKLSTRVGFFGDVDLSYRNRYFVNGVFRTSGSSKFGKNQRFAPFWSVGFGWNVHNEEFLKCDWLNTLRFRVSYGYTGNAGFSPYQAITTYKY